MGGGGDTGTPIRHSTPRGDHPPRNSHGHEGRARQAQGACATVSALLCLHPALPLRTMYATCTCAGRHVERLGGDCVRAKVWRGCCSPTRLATSPLWGFPVRHTLCATHRAPRTPPSTSTSACATFIHGADARSCLPPVWQTAVLVKEETISGLVQGTEGDVVSGLLRTLAGNAAVRRRICDSFKFKLRKRGDKSDIGGDSAAGQHAGWRWGVECVTSRDGLCACSVRFQAHAVQQGAPGAHWSVHVCVMSVCRVAYAVWLMRAVWAVRMRHV